MTKSLPSAFSLEKFDNIESLVKQAAKELVRIAQEAIETRGEFNICLSGGNTPKKLFAELVEIHKNNSDLINWPKFKFFWGDERYVPKSDEQSNYKMTKDYLFSELDKIGVKILDNQILEMPTEEANANITADAYQKVLEREFKLNQNGNFLPKFDLLLLGMGPDGHCASLFPHTKVTQTYARGEQSESQLVAANWVEKFNMFRVTLTPHVINHAKEIIFLVAGAEKADSLKEVLMGEYNPEEYPSQLIHPENGNLNFYVDADAAKKI